MEIAELLDLEHKLRVLEKEMATCDHGADDDWYLLMVDMGFIVDGKFISICEILKKCKNLKADKSVFTAEAVGCGLSDLLHLV